MSYIPYLVNGELKVWFLRDLLDSLERERGEGIWPRLLERVPQRLSACLNAAALRAASPLDAIPLDEGEELLLSIDAALGDGNGRILEGVGLDLAARLLLQQDGSVILGDLMATAARLRASLQRPFVGTEIVFELGRTELGFSLVVGVPGRPRSTKILRSLACGAVRAAQRYAHQPGTDGFELSTDTLGDRASLAVSFPGSASQPPPAPGPAELALRRRPGSFRPPRAPSLAAEVDRILAGRGQSEPAPVSTREPESPATKRPSALPRRTSSPLPPGPAAPDEASEDVTDSDPPARR